MGVLNFGKEFGGFYENFRGVRSSSAYQINYQIILWSHTARFDLPVPTMIKQVVRQRAAN